MSKKKNKKQVFVSDKYTFVDVNITLTGKPIRGKTVINYMPDGTKTVTEHVPISPNDPVFSAVSLNFIPQIPET